MNTGQGNNILCCFLVGERFGTFHGDIGGLESV
jgi:hypothetical protein